MVCNPNKSVKRADKPDSVHLGRPRCDRHSSGPGVAHPARCHLPASSPCGTTRNRQCGKAHRFRLAYLVLLRVEIARFTRTQSARLCCSDPHLRALRLVGGEVLPPTPSCAVRTFLQCGLSALAPAAAWRASPRYYQPYDCLTSCLITTSPTTS